MIRDHELVISDGVTITGATSYTSADVYDAGAAINLGGASAPRLKLRVHLTEKGGTTPTFRAQFVAANDAALSSGVLTLWDSGTVSDPTVPAVLHGAVPSHAARRFFGFLYTTGSSGHSFTLTSELVEVDGKAPFGGE